MSDWTAIADRVLAGGEITREEARAALEPGDDLLALLDAAFRIRSRRHGKKVRVNVLMNAKSGACPEACTFCSQSARAQSEIDRYPLKTEDEIVAFCRENMAGFKIPKTVLFGELPKTSTGKIQKFVLRERVAELTP